MINPFVFFRALRSAGVGFFTGVPDSLLSSLCAVIEDNCASSEHIIAANEGNAVAMGAGQYLATGKVAAVYMQNSGLGNAINPLTSLVDREVYSVPMLLIIGWRGEPGVADEPQHVKQGRITVDQIKLLGIPYQIIDARSDPDRVIAQAFADLAQANSPVALIVRKDTFASYKSTRLQEGRSSLTRETALNAILSLCGDALLISTTGKTSRELFELRRKRGEAQCDFLTVGGMGHASSIALGVALATPSRLVLCLDGDGAAIMHMGALPVIGSRGPANFVHVLLNNAAHESVGGQPTVADQIDFAAVSRACGYKHYSSANDLESLAQAWRKLASEGGPHMLEVTICVGSRGDLGRPDSTPGQNKEAFMQRVAS